MFSNTSFFAYYQNYSLVAKIFFYKSLVDCAQADSMTRVAYKTNALVMCKTNLLQEKNKHVIYRARSVRMGKTVPLVLSTALGLRPYSRPRVQFFPIRTSRPVNNVYILNNNKPCTLPCGRHPTMMTSTFTLRCLSTNTKRT